MHIILCCFVILKLFLIFDILLLYRYTILSSDKISIFDISKTIHAKIFNTIERKKKGHQIFVPNIDTYR